MVVIIVVKSRSQYTAIINQALFRYYCCLCALVLLCSIGCQQRVSTTLLGEWEGRPDTAAARAEREQAKFTKPETAEVAELAVEADASSTDWEQYDEVIRFNFLSATRLEMTRVGDPQVLTGDWQVIVTTPATCTIEVKLDQPEGAEASKEEPRRFELELDNRDGECVGFLLSEVGADRQLGSLYFQRVQSPQ